MKHKNSAVIQTTVRIYQDTHPRLFHKVKQLRHSQGELIIKLSEQAIKMGHLEEVDPCDILNGTCYVGTIDINSDIYGQHNSTIRHSTKADSHQKTTETDTGLSESLVEFGIMK